MEIGIIKNLIRIAMAIKDKIYCPTGDAKEKINRMGPTKKV